MTNLQLYLAVGLPIVANAAMILLLQSGVNRQLDALTQRIDRLEKRIDNIDADVKLLTGKVYELMAK